eukprot:TRINITY_DN33316_c0_g1_i1.p1 TRINITY_DN33316_c0_g1~~TRINITY_DN33316_c0_g1_i1.p1  ORF type:complete len:244 (+),score=47.25 TRINITY_DN33316_c0_g1_i1:49-780(+)
MTHTTYHSRHKMDHQNIFHLSFYGAVPKICSLVNNFADGDECGKDELSGGEDEGDGNSRNSSRVSQKAQRLSRQERIAQLLNQGGGAGHSAPARSDTGEAYLLRCEHGKWKLRNVKGVTVEKYKKYAATPLHFMCASGCREGLILLLQNGSKDRECIFYGTKPLTCKEMLCDAPQELMQAYEFWSAPDTTWLPAYHHCFPNASRMLITYLMYCNGKLPDRLCDDLLYTVIQYIPSSVLLHNLK